MRPWGSVSLTTRHPLSRKKQLALISPKSSGRSIGIVCSQLRPRFFYTNLELLALLLNGPKINIDELHFEVSVVFLDMSFCFMYSLMESFHSFLLKKSEYFSENMLFLLLPTSLEPKDFHIYT
jgi:hypothetical protein